MTTEEESAEIGETSQYPYSVKIAQTALGARVSVHSYANTPSDAIDMAIELYRQTRYNLQDGGFKLAPEEPAVRKGTKENKDDD